jgi:hypothetical protein
MTKLRGALRVAALAVAISALLTAPAFAAPRPVAPDNTSPSGFAPAQNCQCHSNFVNEWRQSLHGKALSDPLFQTQLTEANDATGGKIGPFCLKCHAPVAVMIGMGSKSDTSTAGGQGIPCSFCHQVTGTSGSVGNVSLLVDPSGTYRAQIATPTSPHSTAYSPFHNSAEICGACHNVSHPGSGVQLESTYTEWQGSPQAKSHVTCQDCHMSRFPGEPGPSMGWAAGGGPQRKIFRMNFMGAQVALGNPVTAEQMLKSAATLEMKSPTTVEGAKDTSVTVTITNVGAGHNLPTGFTELREMWLEVTFTDPDGKVTELGKHRFGTVLKDAKGKTPAESWEAAGIASDDRIPPKGISVDSYKFALPEGVQWGTIKAQLLYRSVPEELAKKARVENPTTVMAESSEPVYLNSEAERKANASALSAAASSPWQPLVISVLGMLACFGVVIFFVWWGRRPTPQPRAPRTPSKPAENNDDEPGSDEE